MKLLIKQPKALSSTYEVCKNDKLVARLTCRGFIRSLATVEAGEKKWEFEQKGLFHTKVLIKDSKSNKIVATFYSGAFSNGGTIKFHENEQYAFKSTSWWKSHYSWLDKNGKELIRYRTGGFLKMNGEIEVTDGKFNNTNRDLLVVLGLYQIKHIDDASAAAS